MVESFLRFDINLISVTNISVKESGWTGVASDGTGWHQMAWKSPIAGLNPGKRLRDSTYATKNKRLVSFVLLISLFPYVGKQLPVFF